jgi:hypothetical protein
VRSVYLAGSRPFFTWVQDIGIETGAPGRPARRQRRHRRGHAVVAQIVQEDPAAAILLGHGDQVAIGRVGGHGLADVAGEGLGDVPVEPLGRQRRDDMQALAAGGLAERLTRPRSCKAVAHLARALDHPLERHVRGAGPDRRPGGPAVRAGRARCSRDAAPAPRPGRRRPGPRPCRTAGRACGRPRPDLGDQRRLALAVVALEELLLAFDAVGHADHRTGPAADMLDHPVADRLVISRQLQLGDRPAVMGVGPQGLAGVGDGLTPMTTAEPLGLTVGVDRTAVAAFWALGSVRGGVPAGAGVSASTSAAGLSSRRALKAAWRIWPSAVKPSYSISATSSGRTQWTSPSLPARRAFLAVERALGDLQRLQRGRITATLSRPKPVPIRPMWTSLPSDGPRRSASGRRRWSWCSRRSPPRGRPGTWTWSRSRRGPTIGRVQALGDDAFQVHAAGRQQHRVAGGDEVIDVAQVGGAPSRLAASRSLRWASGRSRRSSRPSNSWSKTKNTRSRRSSVRRSPPAGPRSRARRCGPGRRSPRR